VTKFFVTIAYKIDTNSKSASAYIGHITSGASWVNLDDFPNHTLGTLTRMDGPTENGITPLHCGVFETQKQAFDAVCEYIGNGFVARSWWKKHIVPGANY